MATIPDVDREDWTAHVAGLRRLAAHLVRDPGQADDAVQDAFVVALTRPPGTRARLGAWLRGVLRNKARERRRGEDRRRRHEAGAPPKEAAMDVAEITGGLETQQRAVEAVRALEEPYRSAVWWHYFEGLDARVVAERQGVPLETARTRLKRALERLRADMDQRCGGRKAWMAALGPFAAGLEAKAAVGGAAAAGTAGTTVAGAPALGIGALSLVAAGVLVVTGTAWVLGRDGPRPDAPALETAGRPPAPPQDATAASSLAAAPGGAARAGSEDRARLEGAPRAARGHAPPRRDEGRFQLHYQQGWSFAAKAIVPPAEADLVFESAAGGITAVTWMTPGGKITSLQKLSSVVDVKEAPALAGALVRAVPDELQLAESATGNNHTPTSDVFVMRLRNGDWVRLVIEERGEHDDWTKMPVTASYVLRSDAPVFRDGSGDLRQAGFEVDTGSLPALEESARAARETREAEAERLWRERAQPVLDRLAELDRLAASSADHAAQTDGAGFRTAAVLERGAASLLGNRKAYHAATYSFEKVTRDDEKATGNDWDFVLQMWNRAPGFDVTTVTDDRSLIRDLGPVDVQSVLAGRAPPGTGSDNARAVAGHLYVIRTLDTETNTWALLRVLRLDPDGGMVFAWRYVDDGSVLGPLVYPPDALLSAPRARLVLRGGAGGGNPNQVFLDGTKNAYVSAMVREAPDVRAKIGMNDRHVGYVEGGLVPVGKVFLVEHVDYVARVVGDGNGEGGFTLVVGSYLVAAVTRDHGPDGEPPFEDLSLDRGIRRFSGGDALVTGRLAVRIPVRSGQESGVYVEVKNSSGADVTLTGRFVPAIDAPADPVGPLHAVEWLHVLRLLAAPEGESGAVDVANPRARMWLRTMQGFDLEASLRRRIDGALARAAREEGASPAADGPTAPAPGGAGGAGGPGGGSR